MPTPALHIMVWLISTRIEGMVTPQVPPMSAEQTRGVIEKELGGAKIEDVFEWIDLDKPLGSASLAQVRCLEFVVRESLTRE